MRAVGGHSLSLFFAHFVSGSFNAFVRYFGLLSLIKILHEVFQDSAKCAFFSSMDENRLERVGR
jgi:hypothetical protein